MVRTKQRIAWEFSENHLMDIVRSPEKSPAEKYDALNWLSHVYKHRVRIHRTTDRECVVILEDAPAAVLSF